VKQKITTYEIDKKDGEFVLWELKEEHDFERGCGYATNRVVFHGTKKECLERKRELNDRANKRIRKRGTKTSKRNCKRNSEQTSCGK